MLIRVEADSLCIQRHVSEVNARVLGPGDCPAVRPVNIAIKIVDLAVLIRATNVDDVGRAWWRVNGHIVAALTFAIVERSKARCTVGRVGELRPAAVRAACKQSRRGHVCVVDAIKLRFNSRFDAGLRGIAESAITDVHPQIRAVRSKRELGAEERRCPGIAVKERSEDLVESGVAILRLRAPEHAVVKERRVDLGLAP